MKAIVIVEDEKPLANLVAGYITSLGYEVLGVAESGEEALKLVSHRTPALALLDINICGQMDGFGVSDVLRRKYDVPSIFLTGRSDDDTIKSVFESSAYGYLLKPFRPEELKAAIELALIRHAQEMRWKQLEQSFSAAIHSTNDGVIITDSRGGIQFMNVAAERITGWLARLAKGEKLTQILQVNQDAQILSKLWQESYDGNPIRSEVMVTRRGEIARIELSMARVEDSARGPQGVVLVLRDNTQHHKDQEDLRRTKSQVRNLTARVYGEISEADTKG
jgi:PAS domain S-box-containing protein